jgi:hypothetical protein
MVPALVPVTLRRHNALRSFTQWLSPTHVTCQCCAGFGRSVDGQLEQCLRTSIMTLSKFAVYNTGDPARSSMHILLVAHVQRNL